MLQNALVVIIVLAAAFYVGRRIYKSIFSKKSPCGCAGECKGCDLVDEDRCDPKR